MVFRLIHLTTLSDRDSFVINNLNCLDEAALIMTAPIGVFDLKTPSE